MDNDIRLNAFPDDQITHAALTTATLEKDPYLRLR